MKMSPITDRDFGRLEAEVEALRDELREHKEESRRAIQAAREQIEGQTRKIDQLLEMANKGRGAWWAALTFASGIGAIAGYLAEVLLRR